MTPSTAFQTTARIKTLRSIGAAHQRKQSLALKDVIAYILCMSDAAQWNLVVSHQTDQAVREFLADEAAGPTRDLSLFVEDAVRARMFELSVARARQRTAHLNPDEIEALVDEAVEWARRP